MWTFPEDNVLYIDIYTAFLLSLLPLQDDAKEIPLTFVVSK